MEDESGGLFNIEVDEESGEDVHETEKVKVPRDFQSEQNFERQKWEWRPKCEIGEIWKTLKLPINNPSKPVSQTILHAIEELYFFRRYEEAIRVTEDALRGKLNGEFRKVVEGYREKCEAKIREKAKT